MRIADARLRAPSAPKHRLEMIGARTLDPAGEPGARWCAASPRRCRFRTERVRRRDVPGLARPLRRPARLHARGRARHARRTGASSSRSRTSRASRAASAAALDAPEAAARPPAPAVAAVLGDPGRPHREGRLALRPWLGGPALRLERCFGISLLWNAPALRLARSTTCLRPWPNAICGALDRLARVAAAALGHDHLGLAKAWSHHGR